MSYVVVMVTWERHVTRVTDGKLPDDLSVLFIDSEPAVDEHFVVFICIHINQFNLHQKPTAFENTEVTGKICDLL